MQNDLDPKGLAAAKVAFNEAVNNPRMVPCPKCDGRGFHHGFGEDGASPDWCLACGGNQYDIVPGEEDRALIDAIRAYLSAVPAGDGELVERLENIIAHRIDLGSTPRAIAEQCAEAASRLSQGSGVRVKPLEWQGDEGRGAGFKYVIAEPNRTLGWRVWVNLTDIGPNGMATSIGSHIVTMKAENREAAIAAAQADYEARIRSALSGDTL